MTPRLSQRSTVLWAPTFGCDEMPVAHGPVPGWQSGSPVCSMITPLWIDGCEAIRLVDE